MTVDVSEAAYLAGQTSLVSPDRLDVLWRTAQECAPLGGGMVEVGVYRGGSALLLRYAVPDCRLTLFDTFDGHPEHDGTNDTADHPAGKFNDTNIGMVERLFVGMENRPLIVGGRFPESVRQLPYPLGPIFFAHVDVDIYESTRDAFATLWPELRVGGAIVCDDYGFPECPGAKTAVREFAAMHLGAELEELPSLQARVWKRGER